MIRCGPQGGGAFETAWFWSWDLLRYIKVISDKYKKTLTISFRDEPERPALTVNRKSMRLLAGPQGVVALASCGKQISLPWLLRDGGIDCNQQSKSGDYWFKRDKDRTLTDWRIANGLSRPQIDYRHRQYTLFTDADFPKKKPDRAAAYAAFTPKRSEKPVPPKGIPTNPLLVQILQTVALPDRAAVPPQIPGWDWTGVLQHGRSAGITASAGAHAQ